MTFARSKARLVALLVASALGASPVRAVVAAASTLANDGTVYRVWSGTFVDLFGESPAMAAETPLLALDILRPGAEPERWVVPGTEGLEVESSPALLYDERTDRTHLVWSSHQASGQVVSRLYLRALDAGGWSDLIELNGASFVAKTGLRLELSRDSFTTTLGDQPGVVERQVLHLIWAEDDGAGPGAYYSPIVFLDGELLGSNPVVRLDNLGGGDQPAAFPVAAALRANPALIVGDRGDRVAVAFVHSVTLALVAVEIQALPGELGELADQARGSIINLGQATYPANPPALAEQARGSIINLARLFHSAAANYMADSVAALTASADPSVTSLGDLADQARGSIINLGRQFVGNGLADPEAAQGIVAEATGFLPGTETPTSHLFALRARSIWVLPEIPSDAPAALVSPDGRRVMVGWAVGESLAYRESSADGSWKEARSLDLLQLTFEEALQVLERRLSRR